MHTACHLVRCGAWPRFRVRVRPPATMCLASSCIPNFSAPQPRSTASTPVSTRRRAVTQRCPHLRPAWRSGPCPARCGYWLAGDCSKCLDRNHHAAKCNRQSHRMSSCAIVSPPRVPRHHTHELHVSHTTAQKKHFLVVLMRAHISGMSPKDRPSDPSGGGGRPTRRATPAGLTAAACPPPERSRPDVAMGEGRGALPPTIPG